MNTNMTLKKRILSVLLTVIMVFSMVPLSVFAADGSVAEVTIGGTTTPYSDLASAFTAVQYASGSVTVKLLDDVDSFATGFSKADGVQLSNSVDVTLDLNGHYIDRYNNAAGTNANKKAVFYVTGSAKLTVKDSVGGGEILQPLSEPALIVDSGASLTVLSGTISNTGSGCGIRIDGGTLTVEGGTINASFDAGVCVGGGTVTVTGDAKIHSGKSNALLITGESTVTLSGGTYTTDATNKSSILTNVGKVEDLLADGFHYTDANGLDIALTEDGQGTDSNHVTVSDFGIKYIDADGAEQKCTGFTELTEATDISKALTGWYAVKGTVNIARSLGVTGGNTLNLILCDGATLNLKHTLYMLGGSTLNIYGQSGGTGTLIVESSTCQPGIGIMASFPGGTVTVNIYGGTVTAKTTEGAQPIGSVPDINYGKVNVTIAKGMKCVKTDDQNTAYAYDNTDGTSVTITKCTDHKWSYANMTGGTHDQTCELCGTTETAAHSPARYQGAANIHHVFCACGKDYATENHSLASAPNDDGLTHEVSCSKCVEVTNKAETHSFSNKIESEGRSWYACECGANYAATYDGKKYASLQCAIDAAAPVGGTVTLAPTALDENVVITDGTVTIDLGGKRWIGNIDDELSGNIDIEKKYIPLTVNDGSVTLKNGELFQWWSSSSARTGIMINGGSVTVEQDVRVKGGQYDTDVPYPSITLNGGSLILKEGVALLSGLQVQEGKVLADYLPEGTAFVKCSYDNSSNTVTVSDPQEFVPDVYTTNKSTEGMVIVSHTHDFSDDENACACGFTCAHNGGNDREAGYFEKAVCSVCHCEYGDYAKDTTAPTGEILIQERPWWQTVLNKISFGLFFKENASMTINATDDSYSQDGFDEAKHAVKIEYFVSDDILNEEAVEASKEFKEYTIPINFSTERQYVVYVRLTDHAGNIAYAGSAGFEIDKTAPLIDGMKNGGVYYFCGEKTITVTDKNIDKVTMDGAEITLDENGQYTLPVDSVNHRIIVTDKAGNQTTVDVTVFPSHDFDKTFDTCSHCGTPAAAKAENGDISDRFATGDELFKALLDEKYNGATVTLLTDLAFTENVSPSGDAPVRNDLTIDLNGKTLQGTENGALVVYGGTVRIYSSNGEGTITAELCVFGTEASLTVDSGIGEAGFVMFREGYLAIYSGRYERLNIVYTKGSVAELIDLYGGSYESVWLAEDGSATAEQTLGKGYRYDGVSYATAQTKKSLSKVSVISCDHSDLSNFVCTGCGMEIFLSAEKNGETTLFGTFEDAIRYAEANTGCTVKLLQDLTLDAATAGSLIIDGYKVKLTTGKYTIDLNGKALYVNISQFAVVDSGDLTIGDSAGGGKVTSSIGAIIRTGNSVNNNAKLTVTGGDFNVVLKSYDRSALVLKGGSFDKYVVSDQVVNCSPFVYLSDGYTFALTNPTGGNSYANEGNVEADHDGSQIIRNVTVVLAPVHISAGLQPQDKTFYLTSPDAKKSMSAWVVCRDLSTDKKITLTLEKTDGTAIMSNERDYAKNGIISEALDLKALAEGSELYRVKIEFDGYVLYSNTFRITVAECEHPGYDENNKCTQCECDLAAAVIKDGKTTGYVNFAEALAAARTDENKGCTLRLLADVSGTVGVDTGEFAIEINGKSIIGNLQVKKAAKVNISSGTVRGTVIVAKTAQLTASNTLFAGAINCVGGGNFKDCIFMGDVSAKGSSFKLNSCEIHGGTLSVSGSAEAEECTVSGTVTVNNGGCFKSTGGTYGNTVNAKSGGTLEIISGTFDKKLTAEAGSKLIISGGSYVEVKAEENVDFTLSGGEFTNVTVRGQLLIDCLAEGKALKDMNTDEIIDGRVGIAGPVQVVDHTHTCVWKTSTHEKLCGCGYVEATDTEAPVISGIDPKNNHYGSLEFTVTDANDFTVWIDSKEITLVNGKYTMEPDNETHSITATDVAGNTVSFRFGIFKIYHVTLPTGAGYTIQDSGVTTVKHGYTYDFIVQINDGYSKTEDFKVLVNGNKLDEWDSDTNSASFAVRNVSEDLVITVEGVADITAPEVEVSIRGNRFKEFLNRITFGLFFKETQAVEVKANDFGSGIKKVEYLLSETAFTDKDAITGNWTELTLNEDRQAWFNIESDQKVFVYVRVTDNSGNITVVNSDGVVVYTDAEAIIDAETFTMDSDRNVIYGFKPNGNSILAVYNGTEEIHELADYSLIENGANAALTLKNKYLRTLAAGEYTIRLIIKPMGETYADNDGNDAPAEVVFKLTVEKKTPFHDHKESDGKIYDGKPIGMPTLDTDSDGARTFEYKRAGEDDAAYTAEAPKNVGKYIIRITTAETDKFKALSSTMEFEIQPKDVTISDTLVSDKEYNGNTDASITSVGTVKGLADGDDVSIAVGKATFADKNVGANKTVTFSDFSLSGSDASNYTLVSQPSAVTASITVKEIAINGAEVESTKVYDGTTTATITNIGTPSENFDGDDLTVIPGTAAYADKNVGNGKTVTFSGFTLSGEAAANYTVISQPADTMADITAKEITIVGSLVEQTKVYDGTAAAAVTNAGAPSVNYDGDNLTIVAGKAAYDNKNVGTGKTVTFTGFTLSGDAAANYKLTAQPEGVTADITVKEIKIVDTAIEASKIYDGSTDAKITERGAFDGLINGDKVDIVTGKAAYDDKNVGNGKAVTFYEFALSGDDAANYVLSAQPAGTTASITPKELTISDLKVKDKQYDGKNTAEIDGTPTLVGVVDSDVLTLVNGVPTFDSVKIGKNIAISFTAFTLSGDRVTVDNYTLTQPSGITANIVEYVADGSEYEVNSNDWINKDFVITAKEGYKLSLTDTANGEWADSLTASDETGNGKLTFFVKNTATGVISAAVTENYKIDKTAPTGEVKLNERTAFQEFINKITFGLFFKDDVNVKLTAEDEASGVKSVLYFKSDRILTDDEVRAITDWTDNSDFDIEAKDMDKFVIYVRIEDNAGNVTFIGSDGATFDTTAPEIVGVENGKTYYVTKKIAIDDENLESVTLNGEPVEDVFTLAGDKDAAYVIRAVDRAGNVTEYTVYMKPISSITDAISAITADNVKSSDAETISSVERQVLDIAEAFDDGESTEEERNKLTEAAAKCKDLNKRIAEVADEITRLTDAVNGCDIDKVTSSDKADIEKLIADIDALLNGDNLTDAERAALEALKGTARALLDRIAAAKDAAEADKIMAIDGITKDNVKLGDKEALETAEKALEGALRDFDGNYTEEENNDLETKLETVKAALSAVGNAEKAAEEIGKLPLADDAKLSDKSELDRVKKLLEGLTENEKAMLGKDALGKVDALAEKIKKLAEETDSPKTGDTSNLALWIALLFISGGTVTGTTVVSKKKKRSVK